MKQSLVPDRPSDNAISIVFKAEGTFGVFHLSPEQVKATRPYRTSSSTLELIKAQHNLSLSSLHTNESQMISEPYPFLVVDELVAHSISGMLLISVALPTQKACS
jgi:hypothetical protein